MGLTKENEMLRAEVRRLKQRVRILVLTKNELVKRLKRAEACRFARLESAA